MRMERQWIQQMEGEVMGPQLAHLGPGSYQERIRPCFPDKGRAWPAEYRLDSSTQPPPDHVLVCSRQPARPHVSAPEEGSTGYGGGCGGW